MTIKQLYHAYNHYQRKALWYAMQYEMGEDSAFTRQVYAMQDGMIYARRLFKATGRWPE